MSRVTRLGWAAYALGVAVIALDQLSKAWVLGPLDLVARGQVAVLPPWLNLTYVANTGVSFHLFAGGDVSRWGLSVFSVLVAGALAWWAHAADKAVQAAGLGLIIGGALGNAVDRVRLGHVTDFVDVSGGLPFFPWVFNVADSAITVGVIVLVLEGLFTAPKKPDAAATTGPADPAPPAR